MRRRRKLTLPEDWNAASSKRKPRRSEAFTQARFRIDLAIISVAIANFDHSPNLAAKRPGGMYVGVSRMFPDCPNDFVKVDARSNALAVRANYVGHGDGAGHGSGLCVRTGRHAGISGRGWNCSCLTQPHHDAASLFGKPKVNVRLCHLSIQIVVGESVGQGGSIGAESCTERTRGLRCYRTGRFVEAAKLSMEGIIVVRGCANRGEAEYGNSC